MQNFWDQRYAQRVQRMRSSAIRELLKITEHPDAISFAGGLPAPDVFPVEKIAAVTQKILREHSTQALQYGPTEGYRPLRELLAQQMSHDGLSISVDNIIITSGSQQGLDLLARIFVDPDDYILTESPTYMGALQVFAPYEPRYITIPSDEGGVRTDELEEALQHNRPKFMYILPNFQNPSGRTLTLQRRQHLLEIVNRYGIPVLEDDPYSQLRFAGEALLSLLDLTGSDYSSAQSGYQGKIIHLNTFSKILAPGLRLGWTVAPAGVISKLVQAKQGTDLHTSSFNQLIAYELLREGFFEKHIPLIRQKYHERRNVMLAALEEFFPAGTQWTHPEGGMFLWITLPAGMDSSELLREALEQEKVAFVPGHAFHPNGGGENTMRLSFSNATPERIRDGIERLGRVLQKKVEQATVRA